MPRISHRLLPLPALDRQLDRLHPPADDAPGCILRYRMYCTYRALRALHTYREDGGAREGAF